mgnify:CR=1 FL=1
MNRYGRLAALATATLCFAVAPCLAELKMGFISSEEIFERYQGTKEAQEKFNKEVAAWEQEASERQKEIREMKDQLEKQSLLLSSERKAEIEEKLKQKMVEYQQFLQEKFGQQGDAIKKNEELTKPIIERINKIIENIAKEENYDFIFDKRAGGGVYAKKAYNLTDRVLNQLNKQQ